MPAAILALALGHALFQESAPKAQLTLPKQVVAGSPVKGVVTVTFAKGLHGYQNPPTSEYEIPVKITFAQKGFKLVKATYPKGVDMKLQGEDKPSKVYEGTIKIPVEISTPAKPGSYRVSMFVGYQQCNDSSCFPPATLVVKGSFSVVKKKHA